MHKQRKTPNNYQTERRYLGMTAMSIVSMILGLVTLATAATYLVYRFFTERAYRRKWRDYDDCGMM